MKFGNILNIALDRNNMSAAKLSKMLHVSDKTVYRWINNSNEPDFETICNICKILHIDLTQILKIEDEVGLIMIAQNSDEYNMLNDFRSLSKKQRKLYIQSTKLTIELLKDNNE